MTESESMKEVTRGMMASLDVGDVDTYARLPVELIVLIAEFLVGDFAFGTTANLNLASHLVREETLAVLYETLCLDRMPADEYLFRDGFNPALEYTKFGFINDNHGFGYTQREAFVDQLPNLVMLVSVGIANNEYFDIYDPEGADARFNSSQGADSRASSNPYIEKFDACKLYLYKSCPGRVAFYILKTPVFAGKPPTYDRSFATREYARNHPDITLWAFRAAPRSFCPVTEIRYLFLEHGASLQEHCPINLRFTTFDLALCETPVESTGMPRPYDDQTVDTVIEFAKLAGLQTVPLARAVSVDEEEKQTRRSHIGWYRAEEHLSFQLDRSAFDDFMAKLERAVETIPDITLVVMVITLLGVRGKQEFRELTDKLLEFYVKHKTSPQHVLKLPRSPDENEDVVTVQVEWVEGGMAWLTVCRNGDGIKLEMKYN